MEVSLKPITKDNYKEVILLSTNNKTATIKQEYVAVNAISIVKSFFENGLNIRGIVKDNEIVGFCMYGFDKECGVYKIVSLMIDSEHQGHGYGGEALVLILNEMEKIKGCDKVYITALKRNEKAEKLYLDLGFEKLPKCINENQNGYVFSFKK